MSDTHMTLKELHDVHQKLGNNQIILDVRNPNEYQEAHIKGAVNFPLPELANHVKDLQKYDRVYIHCKRGGRAQTAFNLLSEAGLKNIVCIYDAGMDAWIQEGYPVER